MARTTGVRALCLAAALLASACSAGGPTPTSVPSASTTPEAAPLALEVIGDSIAYNSQEDCPGCRGFVTRYAEALSTATGRPVTPTNRSKHTGLTLPELIKDLPEAKEAVSAADAIIVGIAHNSFPLSDEAPCGSSIDEVTFRIADWSKVNERCAAEATATYRPLYDELFSTVAGWRSGKPTILLTVNKYSDWLGWDEGGLTPDQEARTVMLHDAWNAMLCESATANGFTCADIYHAFNGPQGTKPSADLLADDYTHPSQKGNDEIARVLAARGFAPLG